MYNKFTKRFVKMFQRLKQESSIFKTPIFTGYLIKFYLHLCTEGYQEW